MILLNADGFGGDRIPKIEDSLKDLLSGSNNALTINKTVGAGVVSDFNEIMRIKFPEVLHTDIRLAHTNDHDLIALQASERLALAQVIVADEADQLDRQPEIAAWLRGLEDTKKVVYIISTSPTEEQLEEGFERLRQQLADRLRVVPVA